MFSGRSWNSLCWGLNGPAVGILDITYMEDRSPLPGSFQTDTCLGMCLGLPGLQAAGWQSQSMPQLAPVPMTVDLHSHRHHLGPRQGQPQGPSPHPSCAGRSPAFSSGRDRAELPPLQLLSLVSGKTAFQGRSCVSESQNLELSHVWVQRHLACLLKPIPYIPSWSLLFLSSHSHWFVSSKAFCFLKLNKFIFEGK